MTLELFSGIRALGTGIVPPFALVPKLAAPAIVVPARAAFCGFTKMRLTNEESTTIRLIKWLLRDGHYERADKLAEAFLKIAPTDAAVRRRAFALLEIARGQA